MRKDELTAYAAREAADPRLGEFEGGVPAASVWIGVALVCVLVIVIYSLFVDPRQVKPGM